MPQGASFLRTGIELGREVSRDSGNQVIFVEGGDSFLLRRRPYDKTFKKEQYSPDPSEPSRSWLDRFQLPDWPELKERMRVRREAWEDRVLLRLDDWWQRWQERRQAAPAQAPAPVAVNADLKAMSPEELEAEKQKIVAVFATDPRFTNYGNFTPEEKAEWQEANKRQMDRYLDIDEERAARLAREQAVA